jgi:hypothetical protein
LNNRLIVAVLVASSAATPAWAQNANPEKAVPVEISVTGPAPAEALDAIRGRMIESIKRHPLLAYDVSAPDRVRLALDFASIGVNDQLVTGDGSPRSGCHLRLTMSQPAANLLSEGEDRALHPAPIVYAEHSLWVLLTQGEDRIWLAHGQSDGEAILFEGDRQTTLWSAVGGGAGALIWELVGLASR